MGVMNIEELRAKLVAAPRGELRDISKVTGIPYETIRRVKAQETAHPRIDTFTKICNYYENRA